MTEPLSSLPPERKLVIVALVIACAVTWFIGEVMIWRSAEMADGKPGLSVEDLRQQFTRGYDSQLQAFVENDMRPHLRDAEEVAIISSWANDGGGKAGYPPVEKVIQARCVGCHTPRGEAAFRPLETYDQVQAAATARSAPALSRQLLVSKVHLVGIGGIIAIMSFFLSGAVFPRRGKQWWVAAAFTGLFLDFGCWWLMRVNLDFVWGRVIGHGLMFFAFAGLVMFVLHGLFTKRV